MVNLIFNYLLESSLCLIVFLVAYRILIADKTNFSWMRLYLLVSTTLSLILPLIIIPIEWPANLIPADAFPNTFLLQTKQAAAATGTNNQNLIYTNSGISTLNIMIFIAFVVYVIGIIYKSYLFGNNVIKMYGFIKKSSKVKEENYWIVSLKSEIPAFSFFNYIFINNTYKNLSSDELDLVKKHETVHVKQYHTLDVLFVELVGILFWFNPLVTYLKKSLKEIHEYMVDERIAGHGENRRAYAELLLTLASDTKVFDLAASFTGEHIKRRILMLAKPKASPKYKFVYAILVPLTAMLLLSFSYLKSPKPNSKIQNEVTGIRLELKKYCGVYFQPKDTNMQKPMEIILKDNKLFRFIETEPESADRMIELHFESDSIFSYTDNSAKKVLFFLDSTKEATFLDRKRGVTGCAFVKLVTKGNVNYLVLEGGEYLKKQ